MAIKIFLLLFLDGVSLVDVYGNSPGMEALGDIKQLQHEQLRKAQGIDYQTKPPLQVPAYMKNRDVDSLPGGVTYVDGQQGKIETAFNVNLNLQHLFMDIQDVNGSPILIMLIIVLTLGAHGFKMK